MTPRELSDRADRLRTLLIFFVLQAFLLTVNLHLLPMSGEEAGARNQAPLYDLLAHTWLRLTGARDPLWSLRLLSALFAICSTLLLEGLWLRKMETETRQWVLLFWTFSPCLLLFGRMARPYSLQMLLAVIAIWSVLRFVDQAISWQRVAAFVASLSALLYTDYLPGIAIWAGANVLLLIDLRQRRPQRSAWSAFLLPNVLVAAACIPWMTRLQHRDLYSLTGNVFFEAVLKLAYGFYFLAFGEAIPLWMLALSIILLGPYLWLLARTAGVHRQWLLPAAMTAFLAFAGAAYTVSYPFMGARLLFLLPLLLVTVAAGIMESGRFGTIFGVALFAASAGGVWSYFGAADMINTAYVAPQQQIAATIARRSLPADTLVLVDGLDVDPAVLTYSLPAGFAMRVLRSPADADAVWTDLQGNPSIHHVWFIRNNASFDPLEQRMTAAWHYHALHPYVPAPETYRLALRFVMREKTPPRYLYQLWEYRR